MNNQDFSPNSISHKALNAFLIKATKELVPSETLDSHEINQTQDFNDLISDWTKTSHKLLLYLNQNDQSLTKNRNPKSLMALGAMGAHINMALQALKATGLD